MMDSVSDEDLAVGPQGRQVAGRVLSIVVEQPAPAEELGPFTTQSVLSFQPVETMVRLRSLETDVADRFACALRGTFAFGVDDPGLYEIAVVGPNSEVVDLLPVTVADGYEHVLLVVDDDEPVQACR